MDVRNATRTQTSAPDDAIGRPTSTGWRVACGVMTLAAAGVVVTVLLGAPLVSILLAGLLLLCPLLMWAPLRYQNRSLGSLNRRRPR